MMNLDLGSLKIDDGINAQSGLIHSLQAVGYDWKADKEEIKKICYYTKSRANPNKTDFGLSYGMEQPFLYKISC